ncbi:MAG: hypothetical protein PVG60_07340 [Desulfarculaceae bacterium]
MKKRPLAVAFGVSALIVIAFALGLWALGQKPSSDSFFSEKVGVVVVRDVIVSPGKTLQALEEFQRDGGVRAIVLRVDSPGGGVGASQEIYREIEREKSISRWSAPWGEWRPAAAITSPPPAPRSWPPGGPSPAP